VNLIGEHTDYSLLPVMPVAIDRAVELAAAPGPPGRLLADSLTLPGPVDLDLGALPDAPSGWHRYLVAAVRATGAGGEGVRLLVDGDLPPTGGLSSSSALTVGILRTLDLVWDRRLGREALPSVAAVAERYVGVESGAMDQTVITHAVAGNALRIDFAPPSHRPVPIPDSLAIVAAYSGTPAPKGGEARFAYNTRVVSTRAAALLLGRETGLDPGRPPVLAAVAGVEGIEALARSLPQEATAGEVARQTGVDVEVMVRLTAGRFEPDHPLPLQVVASHVLSEARRVDAAEAALRAGDLAALGRLLDLSHESLRRFGASSEALDHLVAAMRAAGAYGARLTGAGFGGYAVAVTPPERAAEVVAAGRAATGGPAFRVRPSGGVT
jgi:galactokinase